MSKLLILAPAPLKPRAARLLEKELAKNGIEREVGHILHWASGTALSELSLGPPVPTLCLGKAATMALLGVRNFSAARGFIWEMPALAPEKLSLARRRAGLEPSKRAFPLPPTREDFEAARELESRSALAGRKVIPTLEPEEVMRNDTQYCLFRIDVARAARLALGDTAVEGGSTYEVGGPELLSGFGLDVLVDIESTRDAGINAKIKCIGIDDGQRIAILAPWTNEWAKPLSQFLASRRQVIGHNFFFFDLLAMRAHGIEW